MEIYDSEDAVRFYFNFLTGNVNHTGNTSFLVTSDWIYIGVFMPDTSLTATLIMDEYKWVIHRWGKVVFNHVMTEAQIVHRVTKSLTT